MTVMTQEPLIEALTNINPERIGEINLLLDILSAGKKSITIAKRALIEMAGKSDGPTKSNECISICKALQLIGIENDGLELTEFGRQVISVATWPPYDRLNQRQIDLLVPEFVGHPTVKFQVLSFLSRLTRLSDKRSVYLLGSQKIDQDELICVQMLQVLGILTTVNEYLYISHQHLMELSSCLGENPFQSEEDLWQVLHEAHLRARAAEEYILEYEQIRLKSEGRGDLSNLVKRVSEY